MKKLKEAGLYLNRLKSQRDQLKKEKEQLRKAIAVLDEELNKNKI